MHLLPVLILNYAATAWAADMAAGQVQSFNALKQIMERQFHFCSLITAPFTCERSCGAGYTECIKFPDCYNPGLGQICCSDGSYCDSGEYCTDGGCCPNDIPLSQCGEVVLSTIAPAPPSPTSTTTFSDDDATPSSVPTSTTTFSDDDATPSSVPTSTTTFSDDDATPSPATIFSTTSPNPAASTSTDTTSTCSSDDFCFSTGATDPAVSTGNSPNGGTAQELNPLPTPVPGSVGNSSNTDEPLQVNLGSAMRPAGFYLIIGAIGVAILAM
ncbi:hypothetical protein BJ878DRAFT_311736 [Calycina marina]|uniref:Uncharacterized protein n=1 Tax=Calycina marina TaxID=1763456 RepID=A0A9P7YUT9_9HELO|nr:hypothetical protein BJ878DRAFT_311736 [Calycina marina]